MEATKGPRALVDKVREWLKEQGYPLEFRTAAAFKSAGILAHQGMYVMDQNRGSAREIDVLAALRTTGSKTHFAVTFIVECKWSRDKPWVVFTTPQTKMNPSACIAQTIGSCLGESVMHCLAAKKALHSLEIFASSGRNGFGGRRAFTKDIDQDHFFSTIQSVVSKALAFVADFDEGSPGGKMPTEGGIAFPMIVLEGDLFEAYFDPAAKDLQLTPIDSIRLHWRGAQNLQQWISTVDIVKFEGLESVLARRKPEWENLSAEVEVVIRKLTRCFEERSLGPLDIQAAPRGYTGLPKLLREIDKLGKA